MPTGLPTSSPRRTPPATRERGPRGVEAAEVDAGIGEGEQRHDPEGDPGMQRPLDPGDRCDLARRARGRGAQTRHAPG